MDRVKIIQKESILDSMVKVSVVMPCYNEAKYIGQCLDSIIANDYPKGNLEILIYDGGSTDKTLEILDKYSKKYPFITIKYNPKKIQAAAMNLGINDTKGNIIIRMDAHCWYSKDYISKVVKLLNETDAVNVGGAQTGKGNTYFTHSLALAMPNPFVSGNAAYRSDKNIQQGVDTVYLGAWHKKDLIAIGGFDESFFVNEDYELNYRLRKKGGKIIFCPEIKSIYYVRASFVKLLKQHFRYGFWKVKTLKKHPASLKLRQMAAPLFLIALLLSFIFYTVGFRTPLWMLSCCYAFVFMLLFKSDLNMNQIRYLPAIFIIALFIHISWGIGFWSGLIFWTVSYKKLRRQK